MKPKKLEPDIVFCRSCNEPTRWLPMKNSRLHCEGCGDIFPCLRDCTHIDCAVARGLDQIKIPGFGTVRAL